MVRKIFCCALLGALAMMAGCAYLPPPTAGTIANGFSGGYDMAAYEEPRMIVRIPLPPGAVETPAGIILKEGVLVPWRDLTYKTYGYQQNLPERWTKWLLEYRKTGKYPGWHPCPGGMG